MKSLSDTGHIIYWEILLVNQLEKYHMGPLIRCGGRRSACARAGKRFTYLADLPIYHIYINGQGKRRSGHKEHKRRSM
jgi:hypothetical protein